MDAGSNTMKRTEFDSDDEDNDEPMTYKILQGKEKNSNAVCSLLVPEPETKRILEAFGRMRQQDLEWTVCDEEVSEEQLLHIPADLGHPVRTIGEIPDDILYDMDLLEWLIHGDAFFSEKYITLEFESIEHHFVIKKREHMKLYRIAETFISNGIFLYPGIFLAAGSRLVGAKMSLTRPNCRPFMSVNDTWLEGLEKRARDNRG